MNDGISEEVFRVAFVHGNVKYVTVLYLPTFLTLILSNKFFSLPCRNNE